MSDFDSVYRLRRRLGAFMDILYLIGIHGHLLGFYRLTDDCPDQFHMVNNMAWRIGSKDYLTVILK
jgi:hypothetical protein